MMENDLTNKKPCGCTEICYPCLEAVVTAPPPAPWDADDWNKYKKESPDIFMPDQ